MRVRRCGRVNLGPHRSHDADPQREFPDMLRASSIVRRFVVSLMVALASVAIVSRAAAQSIDASLNVFYDNPLDVENSGGNWQIVAKSSMGTFGIAGLDLRLTGIVAPPSQPVGPRGAVNGNDPAGFSEFQTFSVGDVVNLIIGQTPVAALAPGEEQSVFYGVGTIANGSPDFPGKPVDAIVIPGGPMFASLTNTAAIPWAIANPFGNPAWSTAALLAKGTFLPGSEPEFFGTASAGNVYTSLGTSTMDGSQLFVEAPNFTTIVRTNEGANPDYNGDGFVNAPDYTVWRNSLGQTGPGLPADGTLDLLVDGADYDFWKANYGLVIPGAGAGAGEIGSAGSVPEPATMALLMGAVFMFLRPKRGLSRSVRFS